MPLSFLQGKVLRLRVVLVIEQSLLKMLLALRKNQGVKDGEVL
jgi:hypothetical protein